MLNRLCIATVCHGLYANPKSGNQGSISRNGTIEAWELHPDAAPCPDARPEEVLSSYLHQHNAVAYSCAFAGLRPTDPRAVVGPPTPGSNCRSVTTGNIDEGPFAIVHGDSGAPGR